VPDHIRHFERTEPSGGSTTTVTTNALTINQGTVTAIEIHMPSGHAGLSGIQIAYNEQQIIPEPPDDFYHGNKRTIRRELSEIFPTGGKWYVRTYNADQHYDHTFSIDFEIDALDLAGGALPPILRLRGALEDATASAVPGGGGPAIPV